MAVVTVKKFELAQRQLETAIGLFVSGLDRTSAITLAGAADGILHGLVIQSGQMPFSDYAMSVNEALSGNTIARAKYAKHINTTLNINDLKHMNPTSPGEIALDVDMSALGAILKAITNHRVLVPEDPPFIQAMLAWAWKNYDGSRITEDDPHTEPSGQMLVADHKDRPEVVKRMEARLRRNHKGVAGLSRDKKPK